MNELETAVEAAEIVDLDPAGPAVVAVGGGHGLAQALTGIQDYAGKIDAVVTVADDGGSSGRLTAVLDIPPPGDLRRCLLALSPDPSLWREVFDFRFESTDVAGHSLGNLLLAALTDLCGDFETALDIAGGALGALGSVIPASRQSLHMQAMIDGRLVDGQVAIQASRGHITDIKLLPEDERANPRAVAAIAAADQIVLGPGSLFTSVIAALAVPDMTEAVNTSSGDVVYVSNLTTQDGETLDMDAAAHIEALRAFTGLTRRITVVASEDEAEVPPPVAGVKVVPEQLVALGCGVKLADVVDRDTVWPQHDPAKLGRALRELWEDG